MPCNTRILSAVYTTVAKINASLLSLAMLQLHLKKKILFEVQKFSFSHTFIISKPHLLLCLLPEEVSLDAERSTKQKIKHKNIGEECNKSNWCVNRKTCF